MNKTTFKTLDKINLPADLRKLDKKNLKNVCEDLRNFIISSISENGGHFGASLGVVELTVALHYVYNTPEDKIADEVVQALEYGAFSTAIPAVIDSFKFMKRYIPAFAGGAAITTMSGDDAVIKISSKEQLEKITEKLYLTQVFINEGNDEEGCIRSPEALLRWHRSNKEKQRSTDE